MNKEVIRARVRAVCRQLRKKDIGCLIVTQPANVTYITGFMGDDSWAVITSRSVYLVTDSRYTEQAEKECIGCRIIQRKNSLAGAVAKLLKKFKSVRTVAVEMSTSVASFEALKKHIKLRLKTAAGIIKIFMGFMFYNSYL